MEHFEIEREKKFPNWSYQREKWTVCSTSSWPEESRGVPETLGPDATRSDLQTDERIKRNARRKASRPRMSDQNPEIQKETQIRNQDAGV